MAKVAFLACGSFNPLTNMHLRMFELAKDSVVNRMHCQVVEGIISPVNDSYATNKYLAPAHHRCEMIRRALKPLRGQPHWVHVDEWESQQSEWTRTLDVLKHFQAELNRKWGIGKIKLRLLVGADLFETFNVPNLWKDSDIEEIITQYGLTVITRKGNDPWQTLKKSSKSSILTKHEANIIIVEEKAENGISSTLVREAVAKNDSIRYLVDDAVIEYIYQNGLYVALNGSTR